MPSFYILNRPREIQRVFRTAAALARAVPAIPRRDIEAEVRALPEGKSMVIEGCGAVVHVVAAARAVEEEIES